MLAGELRNARLIAANSIIELRTHPARLTRQIAEFVADSWSPAAVHSSRRAARN
jgi:hypothetical protein